MQQMFHSNIFAVLIQVEINFLIQFLLFIRQRGHIIVQPWNQNLPLPVYKGACLGKNKQIRD